ncbi:MAG: hypothetical protein K1Y36_30665 [Blastocatellia bacterium]|nr:hypothetical protein [Blastocatellia bacterium]
MKPIEISKIRMDGGTQSRAEMNETVIAEYAEAMLEGAEFPPVKLFYDTQHYWLVDGFHRVKAALKANLTMLHAQISNGSLREGILWAVGMNGQHGLRRTNHDKRHAVMMLLNDPEWSKWSDREIARRCCVGHPLVAELRASLDGISSIEKSDERKFTSRHGTTGTRKISPGVKPKAVDEVPCDTCGEIFERIVWHCPTCDAHWPRGQDFCKNCHKPALVGGNKAPIAPVKQKPPNDLPANFISPAPEPELVPKPAEMAAESDSLPDFPVDDFPQTLKSSRVENFLNRTLLDFEKLSLHDRTEAVRSLLATFGEYLPVPADHAEEAVELRALCRQFEQKNAELTQKLEMEEFRTTEFEQALQSAVEENKRLEQMVTELQRGLHESRPVKPAAELKAEFLLLAKALRDEFDRLKFGFWGNPNRNDVATLVNHAEVLEQFAERNLSELKTSKIVQETAESVYLKTAQDHLARVAKLAPSYVVPYNWFFDRDYIGELDQSPINPLSHTHDAHAHACAHALSTNNSTHGNVFLSEEESTRETKTKGKRRTDHLIPFPDAFQVTLEMREWAIKTYPNLNIETETEKFCLHHCSKGSKFAGLKGWRMAWMKWFHNAPNFQSMRGQNGTNSQGYEDAGTRNARRLAEADQIAADLRAEAARIRSQNP